MRTSGILHLLRFEPKRAILTADLIQALALSESLERLSGPLTAAAEDYGVAGLTLENLSDYADTFASQATTEAWKQLRAQYAIGTQKGGS